MQAILIDWSYIISLSCDKSPFIDFVFRILHFISPKDKRVLVVLEATASPLLFIFRSLAR